MRTAYLLGAAAVAAVLPHSPKLTLPRARAATHSAATRQLACSTVPKPQRRASPGPKGASVFAHTAEDPSVSRDKRTHYHMLVSALPGGCQPKVFQGGQAWSLDGVTWPEPRLGAYNGTVQFTDGSNMTCGRRERPQMVLDPERTL